MLTVVESSEVSVSVDFYAREYPRLEEAFEALKWWLARKPDTGQSLDDVHWLYKQDGDRGSNIPSLLVIYTFDSHFVELLSILISLPDE